MINPGDHLPEMKLKYVDQEGINEINLPDLFKKKKVVLVGVPGAFTPTCHGIHLDSFLTLVQDFYDKGIDLIIFTSTNDAFVLKAWAESSGALGKIGFLSDGNGELARFFNLDLDARAFGMGIRSQRYSMLVNDGVITYLVVEPNPGTCSITSASQFLQEI